MEKQLLIFVKKSTHKKLKYLAYEREITIKELVNEILEEYLNKETLTDFIEAEEK